MHVEARFPSSEWCRCHRWRPTRVVSSTKVARSLVPAWRCDVERHDCAPIAASEMLPIDPYGDERVFSRSDPVVSSRTWWRVNSRLSLVARREAVEVRRERFACFFSTGRQGRERRTTRSSSSGWWITPWNSVERRRERIRRCGWRRIHRVADRDTNWRSKRIPDRSRTVPSRDWQSEDCCSHRPVRWSWSDWSCS